jgi:hypothetical protein
MLQEKGEPKHNRRLPDFILSETPQIQAYKQARRVELSSDLFTESLATTLTITNQYVT